jgi:hypothetical protein
MAYLTLSYLLPAFDAFIIIQNLLIPAFRVGTPDRNLVFAMLAVCIRKCNLAAAAAGYFQRIAAAAADFGAFLNRASAFEAPWRARRLNCSAERAYIYIRFCKFSTVPAWFFVTRHLLSHSFFKFN